jgi:hypothetical protein
MYVQGWDGAEILQSEDSPTIRDLSAQHRHLAEFRVRGYTPLNEPEVPGPFGYDSTTLAIRAFDFDPKTRSLFYRMPSLFP